MKTEIKDINTNQVVYKLVDNKWVWDVNSEESIKEVVYLSVEDFNILIRSDYHDDFNDAGILMDGRQTIFKIMYPNKSVDTSNIKTKQDAEQVSNNIINNINKSVGEHIETQTERPRFNIPQSNIIEQANTKCDKCNCAFTFDKKDIIILVKKVMMIKC